MIDTAVVSCTKVVRKYESIIRKYFRTKVTYCTVPSKVLSYFISTKVLSYFRKYGGVHYVFPLRTYVYYFCTKVRKYCTTTRTRTCTTTSKVHVHVAIFTGSFINTRSYCTTRATRTCTCTTLYIATYVRIELINIISCTYIHTVNKVRKYFRKYVYV